MNGPWHYESAEKRLGDAYGADCSGHLDHAVAIGQEALVHATLALAAATALGREGEGGKLLRHDYEAWYETAGTKPARKTGPKPGSAEWAAGVPTAAEVAAGVSDDSIPLGQYLKNLAEPAASRPVPGAYEPLTSAEYLADPAVARAYEAGKRECAANLLARVKGIEDSDGSWPGGDVVDVLTDWFTALGFDVEADSSTPG